MASKYWIKLYHETLNDPKMIRLADRLYRRTIELFLLAGDYDAAGELPTLEDMSIYLRVGAETLETELIELAAVGIVSQIDGGWVVTNFAKRQGKLSKAEYMRRLRDERQKSEYYLPRYQSVTNGNADKEEDKEEDRDTEKEKTTTSSSDIGQLSKAYERNIGPITEMTRDMLLDDLDTYGLQLCLDAIQRAVEQNKRKWSYVRGILKNWWADGRGNTEKATHENKRRKIVLSDGQITEVMA